MEMNDYGVLNGGMCYASSGGGGSERLSFKPSHPPNIQILNVWCPFLLLKYPTKQPPVFTTPESLPRIIPLPRRVY